MANLRQDRVSDPALSHSSASANETAAGNGHPAGSLGNVLSVRLLTTDSSGSPVPVSWSEDSPVATLAIDIITASGGVPDPPKGDILPSRFTDAVPALLAARRLQWALEGLAESSRNAATASIAIHQVDDPAGSSLESALESLSSGQMILSPQIADAVHQLPGLSVGPAGNGNWRVAEWQAQNTQQDLAADEQSLVGLIHALGREDPGAYSPEPVPAPEPAISSRPATGSFESPKGLGRTLGEPETVQPVWKKPWVIITAAGAVIVLAAVLVIPALISGSHQKSPTADTAPKAVPPPAPSSPASTPAATPVAEKPREPKPAPAKPARQQPKPEAKATPPAIEPPPPKPVSGSCNFTEAEIPRSISRAESLMYAGKLEAAQDAYQQLLGCASAHDKATEGLRLVKQRIAAQSPSPQ